MIAQALNPTSNIELKEANLTRGQYLYLVRICENPGIIQEKPAEVIKVDRAATVRATERLESSGTIERLGDRENKKIKKLYPTKKEAEIYLFIVWKNNYSSVVALGGLSDEETK